MKPVVFLGDSLDRLRTFPERARRNSGYQLHRVQRGLDPDDWKPMATIGHGVREIRVKDTSGDYRIVFVANLADAVYVLHAFQKKTQATAKRDIDVARTRFAQLAKGRK